MMMNEEEEEEERRIVRYLKSFPPGFGFAPKEEKHIVEYLKKKLQNAPLPINLIKDVDLYNHNPWELTENFTSNGGNEYYFFKPRDRKCAVGHGTKRVDRIGYWESSGQVIPIYDSNGVVIGSKKVLVFYEGKQPNGNKTPWIMHEYKAKDAESTTKGTTAVAIRSSTYTGGDMQLGEWVICKIYKKTQGEPAATIPPSAAAAAAATQTAAAENRLNIIENTATRVENTATREQDTSRERYIGSGTSFDQDTLLLWRSNKCLGKVFKRAKEEPAATPPASPIEYIEERHDDEVMFNTEEYLSIPADIDSSEMLDP